MAHTFGLKSSFFHRMFHSKIRLDFCYFSVSEGKKFKSPGPRGPLNSAAGPFRNPLISVDGYLFLPHFGGGYLFGMDGVLMHFDGFLFGLKLAETLSHFKFPRYLPRLPHEAQKALQNNNLESQWNIKRTVEDKAHFLTVFRENEGKYAENITKL